jgi:hypothetical protein
MKRLLLSLTVIMFVMTLIQTSFSQSTANYAFTSSFTGSLEDISSGATTLMSGNNDDAASSVANIGFTFYFMGVPYTQFSVNSNGQLRLGSTVISSTGITSYSSGIPILAPMSGDNEVNNGISYKVLGSSPNRILVVEWNQFYVYYTNISGAGNMQALLYEGTGKIEYKYGEIYNSYSSSVTRSIFISSSNIANKSGSVTVAASPTYESSATSPVSNTFAATVLIANLGSTSQGSRTVYTFTPPSGSNVDPINLTFTSVSSTGMTVNWIDNSNNETFFNITRATDAGFTQNVVTSYVASTTTAGTGTAYNSVQSSLQLATTYYYKIVAGTEGAAPSSPGLTGSQATNGPGTITAIATGNWSAGSTWDSGTQPTSLDNAVIPSGFSVHIDNAANTCYNLTINSGGTVDVASGTTYKLTVNNNIVNNGVLDLYTSSSIYSDLTFTGAYNSSFTGSGATNDIATITVNKGSGTITTSSPVIDIMPTNLTIKGSSNSSTTTGAFLNSGTFNGILKLSGTYTLTNAVFLTTGYSIPSTGGIWLNNPNITVAGLNGSPTFTGLFRLTDGIFNVGTATGNSVSLSSGSLTYIEGGYLNCVSRYAIGSSSNTITYVQTGGSVTVNTIGNTSTSYASLDLGTSTTSVLSLSGGSITIQLANTGGSGPRDFRGGSTSVIWPTYTGTTLYLGNASSGTSKTFYISGSVPPMQITTTSATHKVGLYAATYYYGDLTIPASSDLNLNGYGFWAKGNIINNGTVTGTTTSSRFDFAGNLFTSGSSQTYSGSGSFGAAATPVLSVGFNNANGVTVNSMIYGLAINLFNGTVTNCNTKLTIGNGTTGSASVQVGGVSATQGGFFDNYPILNLGTGTYTLLYSTESVARTTGYEIPSTRAVTNVTINNSNGVTLNGGDLTLGTVSVLGTLTLTAGIFNANGNSIILPNTGTTISGGSTTSYVNGKLLRSFPASRSASGTYTTATFYPIGKGGTYLPLYIDPTTTSGGTITFSGEAFTSNPGSAGAGVSGLSSNRWEALVTAGSSNLTSTYLRIGDAGIVNGNQILQAPTSTGSYVSIPSASTFASGTPNTLTTTGSQIPVASYSGYFAYGTLTPCATPSGQPTSFVATNKTSTSFTGSWTAPSPAPSNYLVVRYSSGGTTTIPVDYTTYTVGGALGAGTVRFIGTATTFNETGLTASTTYDYYVYSYNNSGCYGPIYLTTSPLFASVTTCGTIVAPGTPVASNISQTGFTVTWTASSTPSVTYTLDVSTNSGFTSFVSGYNGLNVGTNLTLDISGLSSNTTYYVRVKAVSADCSSAYTSTLTVATLCDPISIPWTENFDAVTIPAFPSCWYKQNGDWVTTNNANSTYDADARSGTQFLREAYSATDEYMWTPGFNLTAGKSYDFSFWWAGDTYSGWTGDVFYNTTPSSSGATQIGTSFVTSGITTTKTYAEVLNTFVPSTSGAYYFAIRVNATSSPWYLSFDDFSIALSPDCVAPTALTSSNITSTSATISWTAPSPAPINGYNWEVRTSGAGGSGSTGLVQSGSTSSTSVNVTGLTANTTYYFYAQSKCKNPNVSTWAGPGTFFTGYCTPAPTSVDGQGITNVTFSTVNNTTGAETGNYGNYSSMIGDVQRTANVPVDITYQTGYTYGTKIWIDFNDDLDFDDSGELLYTGLSTSANPTTLHASITIPAAAPIGNHRMRIGGTDTDTGPSTPCYSGSYGTFEDYTANVIAAPTCFVPTINAATNVTSNSATINWTAPSPAPANGYDYYFSDNNTAPTGSTTPSGSVAAGTTTANLNSLIPATTYYYWIRSNCGSGDYSNWSGSGTFTTSCLTSDVPYTVDFESASFPSLPTCTVNVNEGQGNNWVTAYNPGSGFTTIALKYTYSTSYAANTWFFTNALNLTANTTYRIEFDYGNNSNTFTEKLKVAYGSSKTGAGMTNVIADFPSITSGTLQHVYYDITPSSSGEYYFGFQAYSDADEYYLFVDNINIYVRPCPDPYLTVLPASSTSIASTGSCTDNEGWTHYYNGNNLLLSLKLGTSGAVISGVTVDPDGATDAVFVLNEADGFPQVYNASGAAFLRRKWNVNASVQPSSNVAVRYYYTSDEYNAVNNLITSNGGFALSSQNQLNFYKVLTSTDPFDVTTLAIQDVALITHGTTPGINTWTGGATSGGFYAEYLVAGFSGGGAGGGSNGASLPLDLVSFTGYADKDANVLNWRTVNEVNTDKFIVERSVDGNKWEYVAGVNASGNSKSDRSYIASDEKPYSLSYYRLKMMDRDGRYSYSKNISIERKDNTFRLYSVSPNPNNGNFAVTFNSKASGKTNLVVVNALGMKVYAKSVDTKTGTNNEFLGIDILTDGIYTLILEQDGQILTQRIAINK